jgi:hypothetical protein
LLSAHAPVKINLPPNTQPLNNLVELSQMPTIRA